MKLVNTTLAVAKENEEVIGGTQCTSAWQWMHVEPLWVHEEYTHEGIATQIMSEIEIEPKQRGALEYTLIL